jgi:peptidoglycan/LPS O-acetylase OafA/YrhL
MLGVVLYHSAAAYSFLSPYWSIRDAPDMAGDVLRELLVVFSMPFFFFLAGYFVLPSLRRDGFWAFLWKKAKRLGVYWLFVVVVVVPFFNSKLTTVTGSYGEYWIQSLLRFQDARIAPLDSGQYNNMHFWFLSLLLYVYVLFGAVYTLARTMRKERPAESAGSKPFWAPVLGFGLLALVVDFLFLSFVPDADWIIVPNVLQVNVNQLPCMILYFGFGVYAASREWFAADDPRMRLRYWLPVALLLAAAYLGIGGDFFRNIAASNALSTVYRLCFSFVRSFLLLTGLMAALAAGRKYFSVKNPVLHELSDVSFEIYLVHLFVVVAFQALFAGIPALPAAGKIAAVFLLSTGASYLLGKFAVHKHPKISAAVMIVLFLVMPLVFGPD